MYRRELLKIGGVSVAGLLAPSLLPSALIGADPKAKEVAATLNYDRTLVLIEMRGGNDGLNMVVPFGDPEYYKLRKSISIPEAEVVKLDQQFGLHPALKPLENAWKDGDLAVVQGLGYPNPNRSHFRGIDIWNGGTKFDENARDGWLGRIVSQCNAGAPSDCLADGIMLGYADSVAYGGAGPMFANGLRTITMDAPEDFVRRAKRIPKPGEGSGNSALAHILHVQDDVNRTADRMEGLWRKSPTIPGQFPGGLGSHMKVAAKLIASGAQCPFYKVTIGGFDTHAGQKASQQNLLNTLGQAMGAFREGLKSVPGAWERTVVMTYSEFGRRAVENDSGGTDHGTAAPHFVMGGKVKGGFHGKAPSLTQLDYGDLVYTTDYRSLYASVAQQWFGFQKPFLSEKKIQPLQGLFNV
jgi:uncharacterized protein (DUF1501 family)